MRGGFAALAALWLMLCSGGCGGPTSLHLDVVQPAHVNRDKAAKVSLTGQGFSSVFEIDLDSRGLSNENQTFRVEIFSPSDRLRVASVTRTDLGTVVVELVPPLQPGRYSLALTRPDGVRAILANALEVRP